MFENYKNQRTVQQPVAITTLLHASCESQRCQDIARSLSAQMPGVGLGLGTGVESQQMDVAAQQAATDSIKKTIADYNMDHPTTGQMHVFLMDDTDIGSMADPTDEGVMNALLANILNNQDRTIIALLPQDSLNPAPIMRSALEGFACYPGVEVVMGEDELATRLLKMPEDK